MTQICFVCAEPIEPDAHGRVRFEGITEAPKGMAWVWGPVPVHYPCRVEMKTPYDEQIGAGYIATWQQMIP